MSEVAALWQRLERWAAEHAPSIAEKLNGPATPQDLAAMNAAFRGKLPQDFQDSLRIHDGEAEDAWPCQVWADSGQLLTCVESLKLRAQMLKLHASLGMDDLERASQLIADGIIFVEGPVKPLGFSSHWVPLMQCNGDIFWHLDLDPAPGGAVGQVIEVDPECCSWKVLAPSYTAFLRAYVEELEGGGIGVGENGEAVRIEG
jgi:cell wall assembly regulator SMI1